MISVSIEKASHKYVQQSRLIIRSYLIVPVVSRNTKKYYAVVLGSAPLSLTHTIGEGDVAPLLGIGSIDTKLKSRIGRGHFSTRPFRVLVSTTGSILPAERSNHQQYLHGGMMN